MELERTKDSLEKIKAHLSNGVNDPHIESFFVQYLLVVFYAESEDIIKRIIKTRLLEIQDRKVANFIFKTSEGMIRRTKKNDINEVLKLFDCGDGDIIARNCHDLNLQPYSNAIANRHLVSHSTGVSITLREFEDAIPCAESIFLIVQRLIQN
jgi:hypothetical protein